MLLYWKEHTEEYDPYEQIRKAFSDADICYPRDIIMDGKIHRFHANPEKHNTNESGWYVFFDGDYPSGSFGDWSRDVSITISTHGRVPFTPEEIAERDERIRLAKETAEAERKVLSDKAALECKALWEKAKPCDSHPYLTKKGLKAGYGARVIDNTLLLPMFNRDHEIVSLQRISADCVKRNYKDGVCKGSYTIIGEGAPAFMCEGYATGSSIYEATGKAVVVTYSAGNLLNVAPLFPNVKVVADNDESHTGEDKAKATGLPYILIPIVGMDANDYATSGHDLKALLTQKEPKMKLKSGSDIGNMPTPQTWLIKNWVLKGNSFNMTFGPSGNGKTFVLIDQMLHVATGLPDWHGFRCSQGAVLYLCGEGQLVSEERMTCWKQQHIVDSLPLFMMSESAEHLDTKEGLQEVIDSLEFYGFKPAWIVVDTLNRFMSGDENDTQDAGAFISACSTLQNLYNCNMTLVHHTGLSEDAQKRARGSSAFRGALDTQTMVTKSGDTFCIEQTKNKGGKELEPIFLKLENHSIYGWIDEDGDQVESAILVDATRDEFKGNDQTEKESAYVQIFRNAVVEHGYIDGDGSLYIQRKDLKDYVQDKLFDKNNKLLTRTNLENNLNPSGHGFVKYLSEESYLKDIKKDSKIFKFKILSDEIKKAWEERLQPQGILNMSVCQ